MNDRLLGIFIEVCARGGVGKAAEALCMTQPAVSHAVRQLERELGLVLFDRIGNRLHLTGGGTLFLEKAVRLTEMADELGAIASGLAGKAVIRLGSCITIAGYWLPELIARRAMGMEGLSITVASAAAILGMVGKNEVDLAFYEGPDPGPPFFSLPFSSYRLIPICAPGHRFAGRQNLSLDTMLREPLLLREEGSAIRDVFDGFLRVRQRQAAPSMTSVNSQSLIRAVRAGLGVSLLPDAVVKEDLAAGNVARFGIKGMNLANENSLVYHRDKYLTEGLREIMDLLPNHTDSIK